MDECLRSFADITAQMRAQFALEEELLPLYDDQDGGGVGAELREDHRSMERLLESARRELEARNVEAFCDTAQVLMLQFELHSEREERAIASGRWHEGNESHQRAVGLFVERMARFE